MRMFALALLLVVALPASPCFADEDDKKPKDWDIDADRAEYRLVEFVAEEGTWISVDVSPDGETIAFDLLGHIYEIPIAGGEAKRLTSGRSWNMYPRYSPDGQQIAFTSDRVWSNDLWVMNREGEELVNVSDMKLPVFQGTWSRDGRHLYGTALNEKARMPVYQFNFHGEKQEVFPAGGRRPVNHFEEHPDGESIYFEHNDQRLYASGPRIKRFDMTTGEVSVYIQRPGGAANPRLSRDGRLLAYVHRDDHETVLVVHELGTREETVVTRGLDDGRFESGAFYGIYPNLAWSPDGATIYLSFGGKIQAVSVGDGRVQEVPFRAQVRRKINETIRFKGAVPGETEKTRSHRWAQPVGDGIVFEALGDLHTLRDGEVEALVSGPAHVTNPVYHAATEKLYYASWTDDELGTLFVRDLPDGEPLSLTSVPSQYGSIAVSPEGDLVAFVRGAGGLRTGQHLERQTEFELVYLDADRASHRVTDIRWIGNRYAKRPPGVRFSTDGKLLYFSEYEKDALTLKRIRLDGSSEETLYEFPNATRVVLSPDLKWMAYREFHRTFVTPFEFIGKKLIVSALDKKGFSKRVDPNDGDFTEWTDTSDGLYWTRGDSFYEKSLETILAEEKSEPTKRQLSFDYPVDTPHSIVAFTGARVITMNSEDEILEGATVVVENDRIVAVGTDIEIPPGAVTVDGQFTIMPGMFDAHGHYGSPISTLNVIEQRLYGLEANLAYGVTTMYDVYGTTQKDFWVSDMLRAGKIDGPRIYSVGDPMFVTRYRSKMYRPIESLEDAMEHARFNKDHGAPGLKDYSNHTRGGRQQLATACRSLGLNLVTESFADPNMNLTQIVDGFTGIEHTMGLTPLYDDVVQFFAASEIGMTPTLIVVYGGPAGERYFHQTERLWEDEKLLRWFRKDELLRYRRPTHYWADDFYHKEMAKELLKFNAAGVLLQMGAHGQMMGLGAHWEMELFVHGGFSPYDALKIATINGFKHHGLDHELGSIEPGKLADLVFLTANPLDDIRNTRKIEYVMKNGVLYDGHTAATVRPVPKRSGKMYFKR